MAGHAILSVKCGVIFGPAVPDNASLPEVATAELTGLLDGYSEPAIALDPDYRILAANRAYRDLYGDGKGVAGRHCYR